MKERKPLLAALLLTLLALTGTVAATDHPLAQNPPQISLVAGSIQLVVQQGAPGTEQNAYGFEGGSVVRDGGNYFWFPSEMFAAPRYVGMRLAVWESADAIHWARLQTLWQSTADTVSTTDTRAALWSQIVVLDGTTWHDWHIGYNAWQGGNYWGRPYHGVGIGSSPLGPYADHGQINVVWTRGWEGAQGTDSFYPYQVGSTWYAIFGSHGGSCTWCVGVAQSSSGLDGAWTETTGPLSNVEPTFLENPIVAHVGSSYVAVYDTDVNNPATIGFMTSPDGVSWTRSQPVNLGLGSGYTVRSPLSLIPEADGSYTMMFNAAGSDGFEGLFRSRVQIQ
jgi:hypothetical protein